MKQTRNDKRRPAEQRGHHNVHVLPIATVRYVYTRVHTLRRCIAAGGSTNASNFFPLDRFFFTFSLISEFIEN
jgi:hypothetical protein